MKIHLSGKHTGLKKVFESKEKQCRLIEGVLPPAFEIGPHSHPLGEDCGLVLSGLLTYYLDHKNTVSVHPGELVIGYANVIHGYLNQTLEDVHVVLFATPQETGLEYPEKGDHTIICLPIEERKISCQNEQMSSLLSSSPLSRFSALQISGIHEEDREIGICKIFVDWNNKEAYVFDDEPVYLQVNGSTVFLVYSAKS